ncbi:MFS transporter [Commensalibacter oyaizuii]|uniref:MFS transporter n=1 Tax=Commensalibacter oyaizuii TaxID=3043873 RepID=A0ABT6PYM8_9PROT|nr:MFS transporter [Commensalibacter sp. TBRC 16381]MDI2089830.1 MFS transporter [Commensalibacter sp. TBRC 16381]
MADQQFIISVYKKYSALIGTILAQFALGSFYTWSLFNHSLAIKLDVPLYKVTLTFGLACFMLAVCSSLAGIIQEKIGVKWAILIAACLMFMGLYLTSKANSLMEVYIGIGGLVGIAEGTIYLMILTNCVKLFPNHKGVISSLSVGAYGLGGFVFKYINHWLLMSQGLSVALMLWGGIVFLCLLISASLIINVKLEQTKNNYSIRNVLSNSVYWQFALIFLITSISGIYLIGAVKDIGEQLAQLTLTQAANAVAILTFSNLCGRLVIGSLSDKIGTLMALRLCQILLLMGVASMCYPTLTISIFYASVIMIAFGFGGTIAVYPALISDFYGLRGVTKNYGFIYLGFGIGGLVSNMISMISPGFYQTLLVLLSIVLISTLLTYRIKNKHYEIV